MVPITKNSIPVIFVADWCHFTKSFRSCSYTWSEGDKVERWCVRERGLNRTREVER